MLQEVLVRRLEVHKLSGDVAVLWVVVHRGAAQSGINHWRLSEGGTLGWSRQRRVSTPLMVEAGNGTVLETADHKTLMLPGFSVHSRVGTTGRLNVLTRDLQDLSSHNSEFESIDVHEEALGGQTRSSV